MNHKYPISKNKLLVPIAIGILIYVAEAKLAPVGHQTVYRTYMDQVAISILLLAGGYVAITARDSDIEHYKSVMENTPETQSRLRTRYRTIGAVGWVLSGAGAIFLTRFLLQFLWH